MWKTWHAACIARLTKPTKRIEIYLDLYKFVHNQAKESQQVRKNLMIFSNYGTVDPSSANVCCSEYLKWFNPTKLLNGLIWSQDATLVSLEHYEAAAETRWRALSLDLATWSKKLRELMTSYYFVVVYVKKCIIDYQCVTTFTHPNGTVQYLIRVLYFTLWQCCLVKVGPHRPGCLFRVARVSMGE